MRGWRANLPPTGTRYRIRSTRGQAEIVLIKAGILRPGPHPHDAEWGPSRPHSILKQRLIPCRQALPSSHADPLPRQKPRPELLNETLFLSLAHARVEITAWVEDYNRERPHSSLGYETPAVFAAELDSGSYHSESLFLIAKLLPGSRNRRFQRSSQWLFSNCTRLQIDGPEYPGIIKDSHDRLPAITRYCNFAGTTTSRRQNLFGDDSVPDNHHATSPYGNPVLGAISLSIDTVAENSDSPVLRSAKRVGSIVALR